MTFTRKHTDFAIRVLTFIKTFFPPEENETPEFHYDIFDLVATKKEKQLVEAFRGSSKALALDEYVQTPTGQKTVAEIKRGDFVFGVDGKAHRITAKSGIYNKPMMRVTLSDGRTIKCSEDHLWTVYVRGNRKCGHRTIGGFYAYTKSTKELYDKGLWYNRKVSKKNPKGRERRFFIPLTEPVEYDEKQLSIDPYTLGLIIGDGSLSKETGYARLHTHIDDFKACYEGNLACKIGTIHNDARREHVLGVGLLGLGKDIKSMGLNVTAKDKFIPKEYLYSSIQQRYEILRGLCDTDGTCCKVSGKASYSTVSKELANNFAQLVYSLGGTARVSKYNNEYDGYYCVAFYTPLNPFKLERKACLYKDNSQRHIGIEAIEKIKQEPSQCISVSAPEKLFLTSNYVVTHNTTLLAKYLPLYAAMFGDQDPIIKDLDVLVFVSDTVDQVTDNVRELKDAYEIACDHNPDFAKMVSQGKKWLSDEVEFVNARGYRISFIGRASGQKVRGIKRRGRRPNWLIVDDLENDEAVQSENNRRKLKRWFFNAVLPALHPTKRRIFFIGTPLHADSLLENLRRDPTWKSIQIPILDETGFPAWIDRFPKWKVDEIKADAKEQGLLTSFYQEYMLQIMADDDSLFKPEYFQYKNLSDMPSDLDFYITCDLAISQANTADRTAFIVNGVDTSNNWHIVNIFADRVKPSEQAKKLMELVVWCYEQNKRTPYLGVEMVSYQKAFQDTWDNEVSLRADTHHFIPRLQELKPDSKKERRIQQLEPLFRMKKVYFYKQQNVSLMEEELLMFPRSKHDDIIDALAYQLQIVKKRQGEVEYLDYYNNEMITEISW